MNARTYVEQVEKIDRLIRNKKFEKDQWLSIAEGTSAKTSGERVQTSGPSNKMENAVITVVQIEERIKQLEEKKEEIISTIEKLDADSYDILHKRYIQYISLFDIGVELGYAWSTIKNKHKEALNKLQAILNDSNIKE